MESWKSYETLENVNEICGDTCISQYFFVPLNMEKLMSLSTYSLQKLHYM